MSSNYPALVAGSDGRAGHLRLDVEKSIRIDLRPFGMVMVGAPDFALTATPPYISSQTAAVMTVLGTIEPPVVFAAPGFDLKQTLTGLVLEYYRADAGDTLDFVIYRSPRSGHAAAGVAIVYLDEVSAFTVTGAWTTAFVTAGLPIVLDFSLYSYSYRWTLTPAGTATDVRVGVSSYGIATVQAVL